MILNTIILTIQCVDLRRSYMANRLYSFEYINDVDDDDWMTVNKPNKKEEFIMIIVAKQRCDFFYFFANGNV